MGTEIDKAMLQFMRELHSSFARVIAHLAGSDPLEVWPSYRIFEDDMSNVGDVLAVCGDSAKPFLEMRERERESHRVATAPAGASRIVTVPRNGRLDDEGTK